MRKKCLVRCVSSFERRRCVKLRDKSKLRHHEFAKMAEACYRGCKVVKVRLTGIEYFEYHSIQYFVRLMDSVVMQICHRQIIAIVVLSSSPITHQTSKLVMEHDTYLKSKTNHRTVVSIVLDAAVRACTVQYVGQVLSRVAARLKAHSPNTRAWDTESATFSIGRTTLRPTSKQQLRQTQF